MIEKLDAVSTPSYVIDKRKVEENLKIIDHVKKETGCKVLLALKAFSNFKLFPLIGDYLDGVCASSLNEARLGKEEFKEEVHMFSPAYKESEFEEICEYSDHIIFNSFSQLNKFKTESDIEVGLRVNPQHSEVKTKLYDPCRKSSRLGVTELNQSLELVDGLHFHTLCESNADALERTLKAFESRFGKYIPQMQWVNFGGGHHITRKDYDVEKLCDLIKRFGEKYDVDVYLEPGEAVVLNAGCLVTSVLDIIHNEQDIAILDISAATHIPDVLEMPYRPEIIGTGFQYENLYRLGGVSCLAGDDFGAYYFEKPLEVGQKLVLTDMAHYTMVKNNFFNGINLPSILSYDSQTNEFESIRQFGYEDYKSKL